MRLRPERPSHVWAYNFVEDMTHDGRRFRKLNIADELTRDCPAIKAARKLKGADEVEPLADSLVTHDLSSTT